ncbi:winged helix-turn-helix domain-containing protein [Patescibacteria group bacterium]|nr:winged helix-turn-helix domain-containing protein [Patescibacteria group bacterium]
MIKFQDIKLCQSSKIAIVKNKNIRLRNLEFLLLEYFVRRPNRIVDRLTLLKKVWGYASIFIKTNTIEVHIASLRKKLGSKINAKIITVPGAGYMLARP